MCFFSTLLSVNIVQCPTPKLLMERLCQERLFCDIGMIAIGFSTVCHDITNTITWLKSEKSTS